MDFHLTREQEMVRKMYREFAENEVKPLAEELDEEERFPMETVEKMGKLGMMGIYFPTPLCCRKKSCSSRWLSANG